MIFYGWNHVIEKYLGQVQGSVCELCGENNQYKLMIKRTFFTLFFIPLICYRTEYYYKCTNCPSKKQLSKQEAKDIMEQYLPKSKAKLFVGRIFRLLALMSVVALFALAIFSNNKDEDDNGNDTLGIVGIKAMLIENGDYIVYNPQGDILADITVTDDEKRANIYYEYYPFTEGVPEGHDFECLYYYYERDKGELSLMENPAMVINDENFVGVKYFWFDSYKDEISWYYGVENFDDIKYGDDRIIYPMEYYSNETDMDYYSKIYVKEGINDAVMTFHHGTNTKDQNTLVMLDISVRDDVANTEERLWYYQELELTPDSTYSEILEYLENNNIQYDERDYKEYYKGINDVIEYNVFEWIEEDEKHTEEYKYLVAKQDDGYYIAKLIQ